MRHVARRGDGIPATKHCGAYRREDDGSGGAGSGREAEPPSTAPNSTRGAKRGHDRGRSGAEPSKTRRVAQDCDPKTYMYTSSGCKDALIGRFSRASTVAPTVTAHWKANQHRTATVTIGELQERRNSTLANQKKRLIG